MSTPWPAEQRLRGLDWTGLAAVRRGVVEALGPVLAGQEAARALTRLPQRHPGWTGAERSAAAEAVLGVALWRRRLRHCAQEDSPAAFLDTLVHDFGSTASLAQLSPSGWPTRLSFPDWLAMEFSEALGDEAEAFAAATNIPGPVCIRANRLWLNRESLTQRLSREGTPAEATPYAPDGLFLGGRPNVLGLPSFQIWALRSSGRGLATGGDVWGHSRETRFLTSALAREERRSCSERPFKTRGGWTPSMLTTRRSSESGIVPREPESTSRCASSGSCRRNCAPPTSSWTPLALRWGRFGGGRTFAGV